MFLIFLGILVAIIMAVGFSLANNHFKRKDENFKLPQAVKAAFLIPALLVGLGTFNGAFFYADAGYVYHVRTITGQEAAVTGPGYRVKLFGRVNTWKKAQSIEVSGSGVADTRNAERENSSISAIIPAKSVVFLDQVDAKVEATARFNLPSDEEQFLRLVREYRSPENLLRTELIPAVLETMDATSNLMGAEEYFSGGRSEYVNEFQNQLRDGLYLVERIEVITESLETQLGTANAALGTEQEEFGNNSQVTYAVEKKVDENGIPLRKPQSFNNFGITVVTARITDVDPNQKFKDRMELKQKASADRAIFREQRIQEEEQKKLAITRGEREVAERQAEAKVEQIERTTNAETEKQLAITEAERLLESEKILKEQAAVALERAELEAQSVKVRANAEAYQKRAIIEADNALQQKLDAELAIQQVWAEAYAKRNVPQYVFGAGDGVPNGSDTEASYLQQLLTMEYAKRMDIDRSVSNK